MRGSSEAAYRGSSRVGVARRKRRQYVVTPSIRQGPPPGCRNRARGPWNARTGRTSAPQTFSFHTIANVTILVTYHRNGGDHMPDKSHVGVGRLKARLSEYLARARAGEEVVITSRGTPIARLAPLVGTDAVDGHLARLVRAGVVREPRSALPPSFLDTPRPVDPGGRSLDVVLEERGEGW
ncbi:MAG: type II toxin-antitoxin system prevent-host-death family antitoxin [Gemmatimonadales bacterium]|nr:MAG: type II toxin-antitoxin system prevent-host-death family antitoxin [Gemmatimonadales bacterium]